MTHSVQYAIRIPTGIEDPATGQLLRESRSYNTPLIALLKPVASNVPGLQVSLASVNAPSMITAAKAGSFDPTAVVLRVYNPTNKPLPITLRVNKLLGLSNLKYASALEVTESATIPFGNHVVARIKAAHALTTIVAN